MYLVWLLGSMGSNGRLAGLSVDFSVCLWFRDGRLSVGRVLLCVGIYGAGGSGVL